MKPRRRRSGITKGNSTCKAIVLISRPDSSAAFGALASTDWIAFLNDPKAGAVAVGSAAVMAIMRSITSTPPGTA